MYFLTFHAFDVLSTNNVIIVYLSTHKSNECLTLKCFTFRRDIIFCQDSIKDGN